MHLQLVHLHNLIECVWQIGLLLVLLLPTEKAVADEHLELREIVYIPSFHLITSPTVMVVTQKSL